MALRIGVIGYSMDICKSHVIPCIEAREHDAGNKITHRRQDVLYISDGTEYIILTNPMRYYGLKIDQLFIIDDHRWHIYYKQSELIARAKEIVNMHSCVPEEFEVVELELF